MIEIFNQILYRPLLNLLVFIYNLIPGSDFGLAIIILTILTRLLFIPLSIKTLISQKELSKVQPKLKELQDKYKNDREGLGRETMKLYKEHKVNPLSGCLPLLIQLPILIALYRAFSLGLDPKNLDVLYPFIHRPEAINPISFWVINLTQNNPFLAIMAGALQGIQARLAATKKSQTAKTAIEEAMGRQMLYFFPILVTIISWKLPTGLVLYWVISTTFSIIEQWYINKKYQ